MQVTYTKECKCCDRFYNLQEIFKLHYLGEQELPSGVTDVEAHQFNCECGSSMVIITRKGLGEILKNELINV